MQRIDHPAIVQVKVKGVVGVVHVVRVSCNGFGHADDLAHVLDESLACGQVARGEHALAVHAGSLHPNRDVSRGGQKQLHAHSSPLMYAVAPPPPPA